MKGIRKVLRGDADCRGDARMKGIRKVLRGDADRRRDAGNEGRVRKVLRGDADRRRDARTNRGIRKGLRRRRLPQSGQKQREDQRCLSEGRIDRNQRKYVRKEGANGRN